MWLTNGTETLSLENEIQIAAFKNSGYKECTAPVKSSRKAKKDEPVEDEKSDT